MPHFLLPEQMPSNYLLPTNGFCQTSSVCPHAEAPKTGLAISIRLCRRIVHIFLMLELEHARERILATIPTLPAETVPTSAALGRIVAEEPRAPTDLPCSDSSAMDGYAVRSSDLASAAAQHPVSLKVFAESPAGEVLNESLAPGMCVRLFTGSV